MGLLLALIFFANVIPIVAKYLQSVSEIISLLVSSIFPIFIELITVCFFTTLLVTVLIIFHNCFVLFLKDTHWL